MHTENSVERGTANPRNLAVFLDGTWNDTGDNTNVWRLKSMCQEENPQGMQQIIYYGRGVNGFWGGTFGKGLVANIVEAYEWLVENYRKEDKVFIFGFSRGAYTARCLAGFIAKQGLLLRGSPMGVGQIYERYRRPACETLYALWERASKDGTRNLAFEDRWTLKYSMPIPIKMLGIWDTVGAHGLPAFNIPGISSSSFGFLHTGLRQPIENAYHAVAIDEHRKKFAQTHWTKYNTTEAAPRTVDAVEQRWFIGAHANVGGGYPNDPLSQPSLRWICNRARSHGLGVSPDSEADDTNVVPIADSYAAFLKGAYSKCSKRHFRTILLGPRKTDDGTKTYEPINETIDGTVFDRFRADSMYRPPNLLNWAARKNVKLEELYGSVLAIDPRKTVPE